jgi:hypothetical protein
MHIGVLILPFMLDVSNFSSNFDHISVMFLAANLSQEYIYLVL